MDSTGEDQLNLNLGTISNVLEVLSKKCKEVNIDFAKTLLRIEKSNQDLRTSFEKKSSLSNSRIKNLEETCSSLKDRLDSFEIKCQKLKEKLRSVREEKNDLEKKVSDNKSNIQDLKDLNGKLKLKIDNFEQRMEDIENARPPTPTPSAAATSDGTAQEALNLLNSLSNEIQISFVGWNERQVSLEKQMKDLQESVRNFMKNRETIPPTTSDQEQGSDVPPPDSTGVTNPRSNKSRAQTLPPPPPPPPFQREKSSAISITNSIDDYDAPPPSPYPIPVFIEPRTPSSSSSHHRAISNSNNNNGDEDDPYRFTDEYLDPPSVAPCSTSSQININRVSLNHVKNQKFKHGPDTSKLPFYVCFCSTVFKNKDSLAHHIRRFSKPCRMMCPFCQRRFHGKDFEQHMRVKHKISFVHDGDKLLIECRSCCDVVANTWAQYADHQKNCGFTRARPLPAPPGFKVARKRRAKVSQQPCKHEEDVSNPLKCSCGLLFKDRKRITKHLQYHAKKFRCSFCDMRFGYNSYLLVHIRSKHKVKLSSTSLRGGSQVQQRQGITLSQVFRSITRDVE